jgi:hypothetical protein
MKKIILFLIVIIASAAFAQKNTHQYQSKKNTDSIKYCLNVLKYPDRLLFEGWGLPFYRLPNDDSITDSLPQVIDCYIIGDNKDRYLCTSYGKAFWINKKDLLLNHDSIDNLLHNKCRIYSRYVRNKGIFYSKGDLDYFKDQMNLIYGSPVTIYTAEKYQENEYMNTTSFKFEIGNNTKKIIKYVYLTIKGYNAVNDPVENSVTETCIGPISPEETASYKFENIWWTDVIEKVKIIGLKLKFTDNTYRIIPHPEKCIYTPVFGYQVNCFSKIDTCIDVDDLIGK